MNTAIDVIKAMKFKHLARRLTIHDVGLVEAELVLAYKCEDEVDLWYIALDMKDCDLYVGAVYWYAPKRLAYFPELKIDELAFKELCDETS